MNGVPTDIRCTANLPLRNAGVGAATGPDPNVEAALAARQAASGAQPANPADAAISQGSPVPTTPPPQKSPQVPPATGVAHQGAAGVLVAPSVTPALAPAPLTAAQVPLPSTAALIGAAKDLVAPSAVPALAPVPILGPAPLTAAQVPLPSTAALVGAAKDLVAPSSGPVVPQPAPGPVGPGKLVTIPSAAGAPGPLIRVGAGTPLDPAALAQTVLDASNNAQP